MGIKFSDFPIRGTDVSAFNGNIDWTKVKAHFSGIRAGYGNTVDTRFKENWKNCKANRKNCNVNAENYNVNRIPYWYMDYYSNWYNAKSGVYGLSDAEWGKRQADNCWVLIKDDPEGIVFLDIENGGSSYSPPLTDTKAKSRAQQIARAFLERMDTLNGKKNGIYCSVGLLSWFWEWFRNRPLWVAWYNETVTADDVIYSCKRNGWEVAPLIWQYASDGDIDDNGTADGKSMGMSETFLDLNAWVGTQEQYRAIFGETIDYADDDAVTTVTEVTLKEYKVIALPYLYIREQPSPSSKKLGLLYNGSKVIISSISGGWGKLAGQPGYVSAAWLK